MRIENIEVKGVKQAVSDVRRECADRWIVLLDLSDWSVRERGLIGGDDWRDAWPEVTIASGNANNGWGHDYVTMCDVRDIIAEVIKARERANGEYAAGVRHDGGAECGETLADYVKTEVYQTVAWKREQRRYAQA
ncbi:MAG: hypothetical protein IJ173_02165 [Kiritimatiellae bacterium]|nr:hypothetical protein [Kiritimatiellia bacterium]